MVRKYTSQGKLKKRIFILDPWALWTCWLQPDLSLGWRPCPARLRLQFWGAHPWLPCWSLIAFVFVSFCLFVYFFLTVGKSEAQSSRRVWARRPPSLEVPCSLIRACLRFCNTGRFIFPKSVFVLRDLQLQCISRAQKARNNDPARWFLKRRKAFCSLLTLCSPK